MSMITSSQTIGPFSHEAWQWAATPGAAAPAGAACITVGGTLYDGDGVPVGDAQIEAWQPAAVGAEAAAAMPGFRRVPSGDAGQFSLCLSAVTRAPGEPLAYITVFARGLVKHQFCAVFLADDAGLAASTILEQLPPARRATLLASRDANGGYRWDIRLQGERETVFFDYV